MTSLLFVRWIHLLAAATWMGGLIVLGPLVMTLRKEGVGREGLQAAARQFARVTWTAMAIAVATGLLQVTWMHLPWSYGRLHIKLGAVTLAILIAGIHQLTARQSSPAVRGVFQGLILLASLGVFAAAVAL
jgi:uncharacterized membrane protein